MFKFSKGLAMQLTVNFLPIRVPVVSWLFCNDVTIKQWNGISVLLSQDVMANVSITPWKSGGGWEQFKSALGGSIEFLNWNEKRSS